MFCFWLGLWFLTGLPGDLPCFRLGLRLLTSPPGTPPEDAQKIAMRFPRGKGRGNDEGEEEDGKDVQGHGEKRRRQGKSGGGVVNA